jgi:ribosome-binding ATPase YchF (GTP1/OBG family)
MSLTIGLVGKPSSGKSSFFKAATSIDVKISPVPFTTIEPNVGIAYVEIGCAEKEFGVRCKPKSGHCINGRRFVPVRLMDVAGLVPGAHEGKGLGNKFLDDIRQSSALIHTVDASGTTDAEGNPTAGRDPMDDIKFLEEEIDAWFHSIIRKAVAKMGKTKDKSDTISQLHNQLTGLEIDKARVEETLTQFPDPSSMDFARHLRKISKPIVIAANKIDMASAQKNFVNMSKNLEKVIPTSAEGEIILKKANEKGMIDVSGDGKISVKDGVPEMQRNVLKMIEREVIDRYGSTGVQRCINSAVFDTLGYIAVYPVADPNKLCDKDGNVLPEVFLVPRGTTTKQLAFRVHTSMGEKFISGVDARTKMRLGADHELKNGDVVQIVFGK